MKSKNAVESKGKEVPLKCNGVKALVASNTSTLYLIIPTTNISTTLITLLYHIYFVL